MFNYIHSISCFYLTPSNSICYFLFHPIHLLFQFKYKTPLKIPDSQFAITTTDFFVFAKVLATLTNAASDPPNKPVSKSESLKYLPLDKKI